MNGEVHLAHEVMYLVKEHMSWILKTDGGDFAHEPD